MIVWKKILTLYFENRTIPLFLLSYKNNFLITPFFFLFFVYSASCGLTI